VTYLRSILLSTIFPKNIGCTWRRESFLILSVNIRNLKNSKAKLYFDYSGEECCSYLVHRIECKYCKIEKWRKSRYHFLHGNMMQNGKIPLSPVPMISSQKYHANYLPYRSLYLHHTSWQRTLQQYQEDKQRSQIPTKPVLSYYYS